MSLNQLNPEVNNPPFAATVAAAAVLSLPGRPGLPHMGLKQLEVNCAQRF